MKPNHKFYIWLICTIIGINICWQLLEILFYGEIQPRIVDDIVSLLWITVICYAYNFKNIQLRKMLKTSNTFQKD